MIIYSLLNILFKQVLKFDNLFKNKIKYCKIIKLNYIAEIN